MLDYSTAAIQDSVANTNFWSDESYNSNAIPVARTKYSRIILKKNKKET